MAPDITRILQLFSSYALPSWRIVAINKSSSVYVLPLPLSLEVVNRLDADPEILGIGPRRLVQSARFVWTRCIHGLFLRVSRAFSSICIARTEREREKGRRREKERERPLSSRLFPVAYSTGIEHRRAIVDRISRWWASSSPPDVWKPPRNSVHRACRPRWWSSDWREEKERETRPLLPASVRREFLLIATSLYATFDWIVLDMAFQIHQKVCLKNHSIRYLIRMQC